MLSNCNDEWAKESAKEACACTERPLQKLVPLHGDCVYTSLACPSGAGVCRGNTNMLRDAAGEGSEEASDVDTRMKQLARGAAPSGCPAHDEHTHNNQRQPAAFARAVASHTCTGHTDIHVESIRV